MPVTIRVPDDGSGLTPHVSPLAELGAALHVLTRPDHHHGLADWTERIKETLSPRLTAELEAFRFLWDGSRANFLVAITSDPSHGLDDELTALARLDDATFASEALQPLRSDPLGRARSQPSVSGDSDQMLANARSRSRSIEATTEALLRNPGRVRERLLGFLSGCRKAFFNSEWKGLEPTLRQAADDARRILADRGAMALVTSLAPGIEAIDRNVVAIDKSFDANIDLSGDDQLLLVPSLLCHPHVIVQMDRAWPLSVQYPAPRQVPRRRPTQPTLEVTTRRLQALADPSRLQLCALMAREAKSTQELAGLTGLTAPTVSRHLKILREAGVITVQQQGHFRLHHLELDVIDGLGAALRASLLR